MILLWSSLAWSVPGDCTPDDTLDCASDITGQVLVTDGNDVSGSFSCGVPNGVAPQDGPDHVYAFVCPVTGTLAFDWGGLDCDLDVFVVTDTCDPDGPSCLVGANDGGTTGAQLQFTCIEGDTYFLVVEAWGYTVGAAVMGACNPNGLFGNYAVRVDTAASTACAEICDDGLDNDANNLWDCDDPACALDLACEGIEICGNGLDDDADGLLDCDDDDCEDHDGDGTPDACDLCPGEDDTADLDGDGAPDACDRCPGFDDTLDADADSLPDTCDNCPNDANSGQIDTDLDTVGDACDLCQGADDLLDTDGDTLADACDNCPNDDNAGQEDSDDDGIGDTCDQCPGFSDHRDDDGDGIPEDCDNCPGLPNITQTDEDLDGIGDNCDSCIAIEEICDNGLDDDCDEEIDEGCAPEDPHSDANQKRDKKDSETQACSCSTTPGQWPFLPLLVALGLRLRRHDRPQSGT